MQYMLVVRRSERHALMLGILAFSAIFCNLATPQICYSAFRMFNPIYNLGIVYRMSQSATQYL